MPKKEAKVKAAMELPKAVSYLDDLVTSLKAGSITVANDDQELSLTPEEIVKVEVKATQKAEKESFCIELSWRKPAEVAPEVDLKISPSEAATEDAPDTPDSGA